MPNLVVLGQMVRQYVVQRCVERGTPPVPPFKVNGTDTDRSATYDFLSVIHSNDGHWTYLVTFPR